MKHDIKSLLLQAARPTLFLLTFILICAFLARYLSGSETLSDYAEENPELAYGTADDAENDSASQEPIGSNTNNAVILRESLLTDKVNLPSAQTTSVSGNQQNNEAVSDAAVTDTVTTDNSSAYSDNERNHTEQKTEADAMSIHPDRIVYQEGFFYEPLTDTVKERITGISYPKNDCHIPYEELNYVGLKYIDFEGREQNGELICNKAVAQDMAEIFYELYRNDYRLERVRLIDEYNGDDTASMADNNTSCFNYRVVDGTTNLSRHAYGLAIDVNPYYNPYVVFGRNSDGSDYISPPGSEIYADRSQNFPYKIDENDLCYRLFTEHGFTWGGNWNSSKDYQHFQKKID